MHEFWATRVFPFPKKRASQGLTVKLNSVFCFRKQELFLYSKSSVGLGVEKCGGGFLFPIWCHPSFSCLNLNLRLLKVPSQHFLCFGRTAFLKKYCSFWIINQSIMTYIEEQMKICPHVTEQIFDYLDIKCLVKCRAVSKSWKLFIEKSRFSSVKMIKAIVQQLQPSVEIQSQWNRFLLIADNKRVRTVFHRLNMEFQDINKDLSPLFLLSRMKDSLELYKDICKTCKGNVFI